MHNWCQVKKAAVIPISIILLGAFFYYIFNIGLSFIASVPIANSRFFLLNLTALLAGFAFMIGRDNKKFSALGYFAVCLFMLSVLFESHDIFITSKSARLMSYSIVISIFSAFFLSVGLRLRILELRIFSLVLIGLVIGKFYIYDIWQLGTVFRIIAGLLLGLGFIFTAFFYQKFKNKVLKSMLSKTTTALLFVSMITGPAFAAQKKPQSFKFFREIKITGANEDTIYGITELDDEIYANSNGIDLRVMNGETILPSFTRSKLSNLKSYKSKPKQIFSKIDRQGQHYVISLPEIPDDSRYTSLITSENINRMYEVSLDISASNDLKSWESIGTYPIIKYQGNSINIISLNIRTKYLRLDSDSRISLAFPKALYSSNKPAKILRDIPLKNIDISSDSDMNATVLRYENEKHLKIKKIILEFREKLFSRHFRIHYKQGREFNDIASGMLRSAKSGKQIIELNDNASDTLKIYIINGDNDPLTLEKFTIIAAKEIIIFELPMNKNLNSLRLYYGNPYCKAPEYDIARAFDKKLPKIEASMGPHQKKSDFKYSALEPPVSSWIIRAVFITALCAMAWPGYGIIKNTAKCQM